MACASEVVHLSSTGHQVKTYQVDPNQDLFALNINPDGKSFWTANFNGTVWNVAIATGSVLHTWNAKPITETAGLAVVGELTAAQDQPITGTGTAVSSTEGQSFSGQVATFNDPDSNATAGEYSATIDWGDGSSSSAGTITGSGGKFTVSGTHTYAEEGALTVTVTITDVDNTANKTTTSAKATVADAALSASGVVPASSGTTASGTVAAFKDADSGGAVSDYTAWINWGDGSTTTGTVSKSGSGFAVGASHTYSKTGSYTITTTIKDAGGSAATATTTISFAAQVVAAKKVKRGSAHVATVPAACVRGSSTMRVRGRQIASVRVKLDGRSEHTQAVHRGKLYTARMAVSPGRHTVTVHVKFKAASKTKPRTIHRAVAGCAAPAFTG